MDIRDVRDVGDVSEEEPEYIPFPHSFVVEEAEGCRWSMFTDDQQTKVWLSGCFHVWLN
jgi:hypothetical protein